MQHWCCSIYHRTSCSHILVLPCTPPRTLSSPGTHRSRSSSRWRRNQPRPCNSSCRRCQNRRDCLRTPGALVSCTRRWSRCRRRRCWSRSTTMRRRPPLDTGKNHRFGRRTNPRRLHPIRTTACSSIRPSCTSRRTSTHRSSQRIVDPSYSCKRQSRRTYRRSARRDHPCRWRSRTNGWNCTPGRDQRSHSNWRTLPSSNSRQRLPSLGVHRLRLHLTLPLRPRRPVPLFLPTILRWRSYPRYLWPGRRRRRRTK